MLTRRSTALGTNGFLLIAFLLAACGHAAPAPAPGRDAAGFPHADRPVSAIVSPRWSTEPDRDLAHEAAAVIAAAGMRPGMRVADVGAGEGYYTVRLAAAVGRRGRVLAEDIVPAYRDGLARRIARERLDNVSVTLGEPDDPKLPAASFDRIFLIHMYHEIASPYAFLWRLRPALKPGGRLAIVDADRPTQYHGTPPALLRCELAAVGFAEVAHRDMPQAGGYLALFEAKGARPEPAEMKACKG